MSKRTDVLEAVRVRRPEWVPLLTDYFSHGANKDVLDVLASDLEGLADLAGLGLWDSSFRIPRQVSPVSELHTGAYDFEVAKVVSLQHERVRADGPLYLVNAGFGLAALVAGAFGIFPSVLAYDSRQRQAVALGAALNDVHVSLMDGLQDIPAFSPPHLGGYGGTVVFTQCFYEKELAQKNWAEALRLRAEGYRVLASSISVWQGTNAHVRLEPGQAELVMQTTWAGQERFVFELV